MLKNRPGEFGFLSVKNVIFSKSRLPGVVMTVSDTIFLTLLYNEILFYLRHGYVYLTDFFCIFSVKLPNFLPFHRGGSKKQLFIRKSPIRHPKIP